MIKNTLFYNYIRERDGAEVVESSLGFIIYKISGKECFIKEMFVQENARSHGVGKDLVDKLCVIAKEAGCEFLSATVYVQDKGATNTLIASIHSGFEVKGASNGVIFIVKNIDGGE